MRQFNSILAVAAALLLTSTLHAQDTNAPKTRLELFEAQVGTVIVKGAEPLGDIPLNTGTVSVSCRVSLDTRSGRKEYGISVGIKQGPLPEDVTVVDYDELDSMLDALDRLAKVDWTAAGMSEFEAVYNTRGDLQLMTYSSKRRVGTIGCALRSNHTIKTRVSLTPQQFAQFRMLVQQAKAKIDALRAAK